jgi:hypothetical protein
MNGFVSILLKILGVIIDVLGVFTLALIILVILYKIFEKGIMKMRVKKYAKKLTETNFMQDLMAKMTDEELEKIKKNNHAETTITLDLTNMEKKSETK